MRKTVLMIGLIATATAPAVAQREDRALLQFRQMDLTSDKCMAMEGQVIQISSFEKVAAAAPTIPSKDEFETTAQYEARVAAANATAPQKALFLDLDQVNRRQKWTFEYDADIGAFAFTSHGIGGQFFSSELSEISPYWSISGRETLIGVTLDEQSNYTGTYVATNGYGAEVEVTKEDVSVWEIVEGLRNIGGASDSLFKLGLGYNKPIGLLTVPPEVARDLKPRLRAAVMMVPKTPFYHERISSGDRPTRDNPFDKTITTKALVGDIQCVVVYDNADMSVLWGKETR